MVLVVVVGVVVVEDVDISITKLKKISSLRHSLFCRSHCKDSIIGSR